MRLFSFLNMILLVLILATQNGGLKGVISDSQSHWIHAGAKVLLTGQLDPETIGLILKTAKTQMVASAAMPQNIQTAQYQPQSQPFDFAAGNAGNGPAPVVSIPVNFSMPASDGQLPGGAGDVDLDSIAAAVMAQLQNS